MASEAQIRANNKYDNKTYDKIYFRTRKDSKITRERLNEYAKARGESLNEFITKSILQRLEREDPA